MSADFTRDVMGWEKAIHQWAKAESSDLHGTEDTNTAMKT